MEGGEEAMNRELCRYCRKPIATDAEYDAIPEGGGAELCWSPWQGCDQDPEEAIDLREAEIERLERELEQERQDRKQSDLDTIRALGERNDARTELHQLKATIDLAMIRGDIAIPHRVEFDGIRDTPANP